MKEYGKAYKNSEKTVLLLSVLFFCVAFSCLCIFIQRHYVYFLNSDDSSELVLSKLLADDNQLFTDKWYYSTELRVLNTQILYAFFFKLTHNWHHVRLLSTISMYIIMLLSLLFMMDRIKIKKYFFVVAGILCIPLSSDYFDMVQKGVYYIPHISIFFLSIGIIEWIVDSLEKTLKISVLICLSFVLAVIAGMGGPRQVIITYIPLLLSGLFIFFKTTVSVVDSYKKGKRIVFSPEALTASRKLYIIATVVSSIGSVIGYAINTRVLSKHFSFYQHNINFSEFDINRLSEIVAGFLNAFGFTSDTFFSSAAIYNLVSFACFLGIISAFIFGLRQENDERLYRYSLICLISVFVFTLLYTFSDMHYSDRYNIPIIVLFVPLAVFALSRCSLDNRNRGLIIMFFVILLALRGGTFYFAEQKTDNTRELRTISDILYNRDYHNGYATFWNANILTELTDGNVEVWDWDEACSKVRCIDQTYQWLQLKSHVTEHPKNKVFWVLANDQKDIFRYSWPVSDHIIYETPENINEDVFEEKDRITPYKVYGFSNYDEMYYLTGRYEYNHELSISPGDTVKSDSTVLYPDTYTMICVGENLDLVNVGLKYKKTIKYKGNYQVWDRLFDVENISIENGTSYIVCEFSLDEIATDIQPIFANNSAADAKIESVQLYKNYVYYADFWSNSCLTNGYDEEGVRHLNNDAVSFGPYITLVPGKYVIECNGVNLDLVSFDCVYHEGDVENDIKLGDVEKTDDSVRFTINPDRMLKNVEVRFFNNSGEEVEMNRLTMTRGE